MRYFSAAAVKANKTLFVRSQPLMASRINAFARKSNHWVFGPRSPHITRIYCLIRVLLYKDSIRPYRGPVFRSIAWQYIKGVFNGDQNMAARAISAPNTKSHHLGCSEIENGSS